MGPFGQSVLIAAIAASSGTLTAIANARIDAKKKQREKADDTQKILTKLEELEAKIGCLESKLDGLEKAQKITMQDRIRRLATKYIEAGQISVADFQNIKTMHEIYHKNLHGNGFLDDIMEDVAELPKIR
ncbi:MAG: hypothetical protein J6S14_12130 [Clostridia bacterium]|nr:hypothetical protein [Clostridia bacterium]